MQGSCSTKHQMELETLDSNIVLKQSLKIIPAALKSKIIFFGGDSVQKQVFNAYRQMMLSDLLVLQNQINSGHTMNLNDFLDVELYKEM